MRRAELVIAALGAACVATQVHAHAQLERAEPRAGSAVQAAPAAVTLWFSEAIEPAFSTLEVRAANGQRVDRGPPRVDAKQPTVLRVPLATLAPGTYTVRWRAVSVDTHASRGEFVFRVGP